MRERCLSRQHNNTIHIIMKKKIIRLFVSIVIATMIFVLGIVLSFLIKYSPTWVNLAANALFFIGLVYLLYDTKKG